MLNSFCMKIKLLFAILFVAQLGTAQNITFPDPAFKDLLLISYINYTGDPNNFVVYPRIDANQDGQLSLLNSAGQLLFNTQLSELANGLDLSALPNGVYILQFESEGQIFNKKVVKLNN